MVADGVRTRLAEMVEQAIEPVSRPQVQGDLVADHVAHVIEDVQVDPENEHW